MAETGLPQEELRLFKKLLDRTVQIDRALESGNLLPLADLLGARGKILARISRCAEGIGSLPSGLRKENEEIQKSVLIGEIMAVHERIKGLDQKIKAQLQSERDGVYQKMLSVRQGHKALQGYAPKRMGIPRFYDKKG